MVADRTPAITVLVVEDSQDALEILVTLLEMNGMRVVGAATFAEALAAGQQQPTIHLLLTDVNLPDGRGGEVAAALEPIHPSMRTLFMSGAHPPPLAAGQAFVRKPVCMAALLHAIDHLLDHDADGPSGQRMAASTWS